MHHDRGGWNETKEKEWDECGKVMEWNLWQEKMEVIPIKIYSDLAWSTTKYTWSDRDANSRSQWWEASVYPTGAQEWHTVSLLGDVTSPATVAHYVSTTSDLRVLITEKHWQPRRQHTVYRNKRLEFTTEQVRRLRYVTAVDGGLKRFPSVAWFAHPWFIRLRHGEIILLFVI